jgi:hypothetical protein
VRERVPSILARTSSLAEPPLSRTSSLAKGPEKKSIGKRAAGRTTSSSPKDHIIISLTQRVPELEAAPEPRDTPVSASDGTDKGDVPPQGQGQEKSIWPGEVHFVAAQVVCVVVILTDVWPIAPVQHP